MALVRGIKADTARDTMPENATGRVEARKTFKGDVSEWTKASGGVTNRMIVVAYKAQKSGGTHFGLTAPARKQGKKQGLGIFNFDMGLEHVVQKFQDRKEIYVCDCRLEIPRCGSAGYTQQQITDTADAATRIWEKFMDRYRMALDTYRSVVIDTGTELWELHRLSRFGKMEQVKPHHYGVPNGEHRELFRMANDAGVNLVYLMKMKDEYIDDKRTGGVQPSGFKDAPFQSQVNVHLHRVSDDDGKLSFAATVEPYDQKKTPYGGCRINPSVEGITFTEPDCSFADLAQMIIPDSEAGDWL